jgi:hypothetical protein
VVAVAAHGSAALPRGQDSIVPSRARWKRSGGAVANATDAVILIALTFSVPAVILLVGAPLALAARALLWGIGWL